MEGDSMKHYIAMYGLSGGYIPNTVEVFDNEKHAIDFLVDCYELDDNQHDELERSWICEVDEHSYCEIEQCDCDNPLIHSDSGTCDRTVLAERQQWVKDNLEYEPYPDIYSIELATYSDYTGTAVEQSNNKILVNEFDFIVESYGGYGTVWTGISANYFNQLDEIDNEQWQEFTEMIHGLSDYPVIDEMAWSETELELVYECWDSYGRSDFKQEIEKYVFNDNVYELNFILDDVDDDVIDELYRDISERSNTYPEVETGGGVYFDIDRLVESLEISDLIELTNIDVEVYDTASMVDVDFEDYKPGFTVHYHCNLTLELPFESGVIV